MVAAFLRSTYITRAPGPQESEYLPYRFGLQDSLFFPLQWNFRVPRNRTSVRPIRNRTMINPPKRKKPRHLVIGRLRVTCVKSLCTEPPSSAKLSSTTLRFEFFFSLLLMGVTVTVTSFMRASRACQPESWWARLDTLE